MNNRFWSAVAALVLGLAAPFVLVSPAHADDTNPTSTVVQTVDTAPAPVDPQPAPSAPVSASAEPEQEPEITPCVVSWARTAVSVTAGSDGTATVTLRGSSTGTDACHLVVTRLDGSIAIPAMRYPQPPGTQGILRDVAVLDPLPAGRYVLSATLGTLGYDVTITVTAPTTTTTTSTETTTPSNTTTTTATENPPPYTPPATTPVETTTIPSTTTTTVIPSLPATDTPTTSPTPSIPAETPTTPPASLPSVSTTTPAATTPVVVPVVTPVVDDGSVLPYTGSTLWALGVFALALGGVGALMITWSRRGRQEI